MNMDVASSSATTLASGLRRTLRQCNCSFQDAMAGVLGVQNLKNPLLKEKDKNKEKRLDLD